MRIRRARLPGFAALLVLGGCGGGEEPAANKATATPPLARNLAVAAQAAPLAALGNNASADPEPNAVSLSILDAGGLRATEPELGTSGALAFGANADLTAEALSHVIGAAPAADSTTTACGPLPTRVVRWAAGFTLIAREGRFAGWAIDRPGYAFANGIGVGATLRELGQAFPISVTRRADELRFSVASSDAAVGGALAGLRGDARILSLHAGATCDPQAQPPASAPAQPADAAAPRA